MIPLDKSFSDFYVPEFNFGITDIYQFPTVQPAIEIAPSIGVYNYLNPTPVATPTATPVATYTPTAVIQTFQPVATKTITFTVADDTETIPGANIAVNGMATATTDINGRVTLPNIAINSVIKISYMGFDNYEALASVIPSKVILKKGVIALKEVVVFNNFKKPTSSNTWAWLLLGAVGVAAALKYSKSSGTKIVRAKI